MHRRVVCPKSVLIPSVIHSNLDADTSVDQTDDGRRHPDKVGIAAVGGTCESGDIGDETTPYDEDRFLQGKLAHGSASLLVDAPCG